MYRAMLDEQWDNRGEGLPDCPRACAELLGGAPVDAWIAAWPMLRRKFVDRRAKARNGEASVHDPDDRDANRRVINLKLWRQWCDLGKFKRGKIIAGQKGGLSKAQKEKHLRASAASENPGTASENPSFLSSPSPSPPLLSVPPPPVPDPAEARSKRPIFKGSRLVVFEWQFDDLRRMLGPHFDAFDVHEWFYTLDRQIDTQGLVMPPRDGGKWLQSQTEAEARRRGLPIAEAALMVPPKTAGNLAALERFAARRRP